MPSSKQGNTMTFHPELNRRRMVAGIAGATPSRRSRLAP